MTLKKLKNTLIIIALIIISNNILAKETRYFLCGPDEDGCYRGIYQYCLCIPIDEKTKNQPYCLNFNNLSCAPLAKNPNCSKGDIFPDQASCIATAFQGETNPPCLRHSKKFCQTRNIPICLPDSGVETCKINKEFQI